MCHGAYATSGILSIIRYGYDTGTVLATITATTTETVSDVTTSVSRLGLDLDPVSVTD